MKQRNIMAVIFLSIFTLGTYDLFWLVKVKKELNAKTDIHTPTMWLLFAPFLAILVPLVLVVVLSSSHPSDATNRSATLLVILIELIAVLVILPITFYWFFKFSKAVNRYTGGELNTAVTFLLLWMLRFIGLAIIQDKFNDMIAAGATSANPVVASAPSAPAAPIQQNTTVQDNTPPPQPPVTPQV